MVDSRCEITSAVRPAMILRIASRICDSVRVSIEMASRSGPLPRCVTQVALNYFKVINVLEDDDRKNIIDAAVGDREHVVLDQQQLDIAGLARILLRQRQ